MFILKLTGPISIPNLTPNLGKDEEVCPFYWPVLFKLNSTKTNARKKKIIS